MGKSSSKRLTVREKNKNKKKQAERDKKARKASKRGALAGGRGKKGKADPGIPALHPLKEKLLAQLERRREEYLQDLNNQKDLRAAAQRDASLSLMADRAHDQGVVHEERDVREAAREHKLFTTSEGSRSAFYKEFEKVVEEADVILQVLDARDPLGSRSPVLESEILAKNPDKRIVLILNKVDLVPKEVVQAWLTYLRAELPTIAFKCATTQGAIRRKDAPATLLEAGTGTGTLSLSASTVLGGSSLLQLLKNYARSRSAGGSGPSAAISVGIIGFPNVGKSSLINSMKREKTSGTSSTPGSTKRMQSIQLDKQVRLLDCPGIVFAEHAAGDQLILQNAVNIDQLTEPTLAVDSLVRRVPKSVLLEQYSVADYDVTNPTEFLTLVAKRRGKLLQGGIPDLDASARVVLRDWVKGRIPFYTVPPARNVAETKTVVTGWAPEFNMDATMDVEVLGALERGKSGAGAISIGPSRAAASMEVEEDDDGPRLDTATAGLSASVVAGFFAPSTSGDSSSAARPGKRASADDVVPPGESAALNPQHNRTARKAAKQKKAAARRAKRSAIDEEDYDFMTDFS